MEYQNPYPKNYLNPFCHEVRDGISLFTAVKNRRETLEESLKTWLSCDQIDEIIIVDWSSDESLVSLVQKYQNGNIILAVVPDQPRWILSHACNLAARLTSKSKILKMDADVKILPGFFEQHALEPGIFFTGNWKIAKDDNEKHLHGVSFMFRDSFFAVNGYNEFIKSYGWDDIDLYNRLEANSMERRDFNHDTLFHIPHEQRTSLQNHINFIDNINDTEKSLLNSLVNRFVSSSYKPWTMAEIQLEFSVEVVMPLIIKCTQVHDDQNIVPSEVMFQCEREAIIERFYELGAGLSKKLLLEFSRDELISLLNLFYARHNSPEALILFNLIQKDHTKFEIVVEEKSNEINTLIEKVQSNKENLNARNEIVKYKNHVIENLTHRLNSEIKLTLKNDNQGRSFSDFFSLKKSTIPEFEIISSKSHKKNQNYPQKVNLGNQVGAYYGSHRSGWGYAFSALSQLNNPNGILMDAFIERTFHWHPEGIRPHLEPWIGFIHVPPYVPYWFVHEVANESIFSLPEWQESYKHCKGLYTLSKYHQRFLQSKLNVPINSVLHPTEVPALKWEWTRFQQNSEKKVIQVGFWLRKLYAIHLLQADNYEKIFLRKKDSNIDHLLKEERKNCELSDQITEEAINSVHNIEFLSNEDYDRLLTENIVFMDLYDASANNSVIECIVRNTPILVNPLEPVVEYLGAGYPFYFNSLDEATEKLGDIELIRETHHYLQNLPIKKRLTQEYFLQSVVESSIYKSL